jgi:hypothetical protein
MHRWSQDVKFLISAIVNMVEIRICVIMFIAMIMIIIIITVVIFWYNLFRTDFVHVKFVRHNLKVSSSQCW